MNKKFQVFVSSTYSDLKAERQACVEAILTAGHIPAGMELFSAGDESQLEIINRWIDQSDIYMLLLGGRYGTIEEKSGLSYTELEYRYAVNSGKPFFALVMDENFLDQKVKSEGKQVLELENREKYEKFRALVLSKISKFFTNTDKLQLGILQSLVDIQGRHTLSGWVRANEGINSAMVLNQIATLTEMNRELTDANKRLESALETFKSDSSDDRGNLINELSIEAKMLVISISEDEKGTVSVTKFNESFSLRTNGINFPADDTPRAKAAYASAINQLLAHQLLEEYEMLNIGNMMGFRNPSKKYLLTTYGYTLADELKKERYDEQSQTELLN